jgi:hypothetical protein
MGWTVVEALVDYPEDTNPTGTGIWPCIEALRSGRADILVIPHLDTFSRDPDRILALLLEADERGFFVASLDERFDTSAYYGAVASACLRTLLAWARTKRREDMKDGEDKEFSQARMASFAQCIERTVQLRLDGLRWSKVAQALNAEGYGLRQKDGWTAKAICQAYEVARDIGLFDELTLRPQSQTVVEEEDQDA